MPGSVPLGAALCDRLLFREQESFYSHQRELLLRNHNTAGTSSAVSTDIAMYCATCDGRQIKGTVVLGLGFFFTFTAWHSAQNLQSSLPLHAGVHGDTALGIVYSLLPVGYLLAPTIIRYVGLKPTIVVPMCMYGTFIAANMYPRWWTLYPAACNVGLACGPLFVSQNTLLTRLALSYAGEKGLPPTSRVGMFQGIFMSIFMTTQLVGNTFYAIFFRILGDDSDGESDDSGDDAPARSTIVLLFGIYTLFVIAGASLICCGLQIPPALPVEQERKKTDRQQQSMEQVEKIPSRDLSAVLRLLLARKMQALIPLVLSTGFMGSFVTADFTSQVVKPALGEANLGFIMAMVGGASVLANAVCGRLSDSSGSTSRVAVFVVALAINSAVSGLLYVFHFLPCFECDNQAHDCHRLVTKQVLTCQMTNRVDCRYWWEPTKDKDAWVSISVVGIAIGLSSAASQTMLYSHLSASWIGETDAAFACSNGLAGFAQCVGFFCAGSLPMHTMLMVGVPAQLIGGIGFILSVVWSQDK